MALERLQSVFNDIYQNEARSTDDIPSPSIDEIGDDHFYGSGFFDSINQVLQPDGTYQPYGTIPINTVAENAPMSKKLLISEAEPTTNYWSGYENQKGVKIKDTDGIEKFYEGLIQNGSGETDSIRFRHNQGANIGTDNALGRGKFQLESIFDPTHGGGYEDRNEFLRAGMGSTEHLNIKNSSTFFRKGAVIFANTGDIGKEPYIVHNIPSGKKGRQLGQNRNTIPFRAAADDLLRFASYYTSPKGLVSMLAENTTNNLIGDAELLQLPPQPLSGIMAPPIPVPMTGFLNFYHQSLQSRSATPDGGSVRKPFKIQYSRKASLGLPFSFHGDATPGIDAFAKIEIPPGETKFQKLKNKALRKLQLIAYDKLTSAVQLPTVGKPTPFIDLTGPGVTRTDDKINNFTYQPGDDTVKADHGILPPMETDLSDPIKKGDFYVRFKDLRNNYFLYFRGFVTGINENITPSYSPTQYIGRSEDVYVYQKAERDLSFNLKVYPQNQPEQEIMYQKMEALTSMAYPQYHSEENSTSIQRMKAPFTELYMAHIGDRAQGQFGFIKSLTYTVPEGGDWDAYSALPRMFEIAISYQILNRRPPQMGTKFYRGHGQLIKS
tara:strand:+ start:184 stop:2004 length:1821 start_codon:yes stop_codon:yes gene_type:complete